MNERGITPTGTLALPFAASGFGNANTAQTNGFAFSKYAAPLAEWTMARLVCRTDAWGAYQHGSQVTKYGTLTQALLERHYRGESIVGLHTADADNRCRCGAVDIDMHGNEEPIDRSIINRRAGVHWHNFLVRIGFRPLLYSSNGKGGYHLRILLAEPIDAGRVHAFLKRLVSDYERLHLSAPPEIFPKQPDVRKCAKGLGNWIRLPGRHHKREHWSMAWEGEKFLQGEAAVLHMLALQGDPPWLIPDTAISHQLSAIRQPKKAESGRRIAESGIDRRVELYMRCLPNLGEGQGRDDVAYRFGCYLTRDMALPKDRALDWLAAWDEGNRPPKGRERLLAILNNCLIYGQKAVGNGVRP